MVQASGANQASHYALIRALDSGTARIDPWHAETADKSYFEGHYYSVKAPGVAFATLPWFAATDAAGLLDEVRAAGEREAREAPVPDARAQVIREQRTVTWLLGLWAVVLPALALLVLVRSAAERLAPGYGTAAAVALGAATLVLPYSTMLYAHVPAAALALGSYLLARRERFLLAGLLGGLAAVVEYPVGLIAAVLAVWTRSPRYVLGVVAGLLPLAAYNLWAFGSVTHMSYDDVVGFEGIEEGVFGITLPDPAVAWDLLLAPKGLLLMTPVAALGAWGLWRLRSWPLLAAAAVVFLYDAAYFSPFGGDVPGPRFLVPILPFLALGLAVALRERLATTAALAAASAVGMVAATITEPQLVGQDTGRWVDLLGDGDLQFTVAGAAGTGHGWLGIAPFLALVALAVVLAARTLPRTTPAPRAGAFAALGAWAVVAFLLGDAPELVSAGLLAGVGAALWSGRSRPCSGKVRSPAPSTASSTTATPPS